MTPRLPTGEPAGEVPRGHGASDAAPPVPPAALPAARGLRLLLVEDNPADVELIINLLRRSGRDLSVFVVETQETFEAELRSRPPNLILSDYRLPTFNGLVALDIAQRTAPDIPFIFVTGAMGEDIAVETLKLGATDYILKSGLTRLVPAVGRALREAEQSREHEAAAAALQRSHDLLRAMTKRLLLARDREKAREAEQPKPPPSDAPPN
jgi:DNA-binding NtrC family response regulator